MLGNIRELIHSLWRQGAVQHPALSGRDWRTPVGDAIGIGPAANDLPDWELALSLVDRDDQVLKMSDRLDEFAKIGAGRSLLVILRGSNLDCHKYFPARCATWDFKQKTGKDWANFGTLKWWPRLPRVYGGIGEKLGADNVEDIATLSGLLKEQDRYICFSHIVGPGDWGATKEEIWATGCKCLPTSGWPYTRLGS
jgi:hypothetical protein